MHNVAAGVVSSTSTDAINGSQLYGVAAIASKGWNLQANSGTADNIAPGDTVNVVDGSNTTVAYDATTNQLKVSVVNAPVFSGSVTAAGFNATGNKITNVAAGTAATDAVNVGQLTGTLTGLGGGATVKADGTIQAPSYVTYNADGTTTTVNNVGSALDQLNSQGTKYFHTNSTAADSQALGTDSTAIGPNAVATATNAVAMGNGATASTANSVALGAGSVTGAVHTGTLAMYGGTAAGVGNDTFGTVSVGMAAAPRQVQNVAAGVISGTSTDAINGSQLYTITVGVNSLGSTTAAALGGGSTFNTTTGAVSAPTYNVIGGSVTSVGAAVTNIITQGPVQYSTSNGTPTPYTPSNSVTLVGASAGPVSLNNVAPAEISATSTQAVNGSQLFATNNAIGAVQYQVYGLQTTLSPIIQNITVAESRGSGATGVVSGAGQGSGNHLTQTHETLRGMVDPVIRVNAADCTTATGYDTTSVGLCARSGNGDGSQTSGATAIGSNAWALNYNSTAIGFRSTVTADNSVALGANSVAYEANTVSIGSAGNERRITNVAEGIHGTDAVNVNQLKTAYAGIAMSVSLNSVHIPTLAPGEQGFGAGLGYYKGKTAVGAFYRSLNETGDRAIGGGVATDGKDFTVNVGIGWKWK